MIEELEGWAARDKNNELWFYIDEEPKLYGALVSYYAKGKKFLLPYSLFPNILFVNSPKKVKIKIEVEDE